jgi:hypothetical protein
MAEKVLVGRSSGFWTGQPVKVSWGAIFAGVLTSLGIWVLLYSLGLAIGLSSVDPADPGSAKGAGIGTGVWGLIAPLIALFAGGVVASRSAGIMDRTGGAIHGVVLWSLTTLAGMAVLGMVLSSLVSGVASAGKAAAGAVGGVASSAANNQDKLQGAAQSFGLNADDALRPVNERLRAEGKPAVTSAQLQAAVKDVVGDAVKQGRMDRELLVSSIAQKTALSRADSEDLAGRVEAQYEAAKGKAQQTVATVQTGALKAADATGKAFWGIFGALFLGLISAVLGATAGVTKRQRAQADGGIPASPLIRREVHP